MSLLKYKNRMPVVEKDVFVARGAYIIGDVQIKSESSVWFNTVLRGDVNFIRVGRKTNIQDLSVVHVDSKTYPTIIGDEVTIGHKALVHACTIGNRCLIGMGAIIMDGVEIGDDCIVAAGSLVTGGTKFPAGSLIKGTPAKVAREVREDERVWLKESAQNYFELAQSYFQLNNLKYTTTQPATSDK